MQTLKIAPDNEPAFVEEVTGRVTLLQFGDEDYSYITEGREQPDLPRVILDYRDGEGEHCRHMIFASDRAWVMNSNGKTVASI